MSAVDAEAELEVEMLRALRRAEYAKAKALALRLLTEFELPSKVRKYYRLILGEICGKSEPVSHALEVLFGEIDGSHDDYVVLFDIAKLFLSGNRPSAALLICGELVARADKECETRINLSIQSAKIDALWMMLTCYENLHLSTETAAVMESLSEEPHLTASHYSLQQIEHLLAKAILTTFCVSYLRRLRSIFLLDVAKQRCQTRATLGHECDFIDILLNRHSETPEEFNRVMNPMEPLPTLYIGSVTRKRQRG